MNNDGSNQQQAGQTPLQGSSLFRQPPPATLTQPVPRGAEGSGSGRYALLGSDTLGTAYAAHGGDVNADTRAEADNACGRRPFFDDSDEDNDISWCDDSGRDSGRQREEVRESKDTAAAVLALCAQRREFQPGKPGV